MRNVDRQSGGKVKEEMRAREKMIGVEANCAALHLDGALNSALPRHQRRMRTEIRQTGGKLFFSAWDVECCGL